MIDSSSDATATPAPKRVLICMEDSDSLRIYRFRLSIISDFHIFDVPDGEAVLEAVEHSRPDLIIISLHLPKVNGREVLRRLRAREETRNTPILMDVSCSMRGDDVKVLREGATAVVRKPVVAPKDLRAELEAIFGALPPPTRK